MNTTLLTVIIIIYLMAIGYLGFLGFKKTKSDRDYLVAGRSIHPFVMALSYGATFISTSAIVGFGGVAGLFGMGLLWLTFLNIFVGIFIAFVFFGKRTRKMGHNLDAHTFPELLAKRYDSKFIQAFSGLLIFCAMPLYASVVLIGGARFIEEILQIDFQIALMVFSVIIAAYVIAGGLKGVMYTDALQGGIMFFGMLFLLIMTYYKLGGVVEAHERLTAMAELVPEKLQKAGHLGWTVYPATGSGWWWTLTSTIILGVGIGVLAQPQLIVRFMTVRSNRELNRAVLVGGVFIFIMTGVAFIVGSLSNVFYYEIFGEGGKISIAAAKGNVDRIIPNFINDAMPDWFVYLFMIALLSAAMSTLSSQFHAMGTSIGRDFAGTIFKGANSTLVTRVGVVVAILLSVILGMQLPAGVVARGTAIFFGVCAASFLPAYFGGIYWKKATKAGAIASCVAGTLTSLFCLAFLHHKEAKELGICNFLFGTKQNPVHSLLQDVHPWPVVDPILISLPVAIVAFVVVSLITLAPSSEVMDKSFKGI